MELQTKIRESIASIQKAESLALQYQDYGFHLAFSGGKDSMVIYELCKMAGVKFRPVMNITTLDYPELMRFVRENYPDVEFVRPDINFYKLIVKKKMLPMRTTRYCCAYLKESGGAGTVTILGIRKEESTKRAGRNELEINGRKYSNSLDQFNIDQDGQVLCLNGKDKIMLLPILNWTFNDVWKFIRERKLKYCELYKQGYVRIGCMFCPMSSNRIKQLDRKRYPKVVRIIKNSISELIEQGYQNELNDNVDDIFDWWVLNSPKLHTVDQFKKHKARPRLFDNL